MLARVILGYNHYIRYGLLLATLLLGCSLSYYNIRIPWTLSSVPYATVMVVAGHELKHYASYIERPKFWIAGLLLLMTAGISYFWVLAMYINRILPVVPLTIGALSGTIMTFMCSSIMVKRAKHISRTLIKIGRETFIVVAFSQIIIMSFNKFITDNSVIKYLSLIIILIGIKYLKDYVKFVYHKFRS